DRAAGYDKSTGWNVEPWHGVASHTYDLDAPKLVALLNEVARKLRDRGDFKSRLWITEVGAEAAPPTNPNQPPTQAEIDQAYYLNAVYSGILENSELHDNVAHVFWFKYEDFVPG